MSDEETRYGRAQKIKRNPVAEDLRTEKYRLRRVEDKRKRLERKSSQQLLKEVFEEEEYGLDYE